MSKETERLRRISAWQLRAMLATLADEICSANDTLTVANTGDTFRILVEGGSIAITINETGKGGAL